MLRRLAVVCLVAPGLIVVGASPSSAAPCPRWDPDCGGSETPSPPPSTGGQTITVTVTGSFVGQASPGSSGTTSVTVPTPCGYTQGMTGQEYFEWVESGRAARDWYRMGGGSGAYEPRPGYRQHKGDTEGHWYGGMCSSGGFEDLDEFFDFADDWFADNESVYVEPGGEPPVPPVPPEVLREAAQEAVTLPEPEFVWNPKRRADTGTVVNLDTWFWLEPDAPTSGSVSATAGTNTATVEFGLTNVDYVSATAGSVACEDGGTVWSIGGSSDCVLTFPQESAGERVDANASWGGSWSFNGTPQGELDPIAADWTTTFPVASVQSLVTDID